ncbi:uncharacterized protein LOC135495770 [Lineus longissimus]|uniref:uncharacterized protein LOC135489404 n=2 Tax=Lineus longissimus TaxID=88925 RepID=UPI00315CF367
MSDSSAISDFQVSDSDNASVVTSSSNFTDSGDESVVTGVILGYQFEPVVEGSFEDMEEGEDVDDEEEEDRFWRLRMEEQNWCICGDKCEVQDVPIENACCHEKEPILRKIEAYNEEHGGNIRCITEHPGFQSNCLDVWVLQTAYSHYKQQYRAAVDGETNEKYRYVAYRQLVRWCWGFLGKKNRVPLPACALEKIRLRFYVLGDAVGFKYPTLDD